MYARNEYHYNDTIIMWGLKRLVSSYSHDDDRSTMVNKMDGGD